MYITIDPSNGLPIYLQIMAQIKTNIAMGRLLPEDPLPSVRQLAIDLAVNPNTIARAYRDLEFEGVIYKRHGQGTFVSSQGVEMSKRERKRVLSALIEKAIVEGTNLSLDEEDMRDIFEQVMEKFISSRALEKTGTK
ncbi:MAG TPA: GntR family transcriptional regulator [Blastocatellia bacterium]|nr:GntR family transcriptional regulator [Blastocatellia bacterium]